MTPLDIRPLPLTEPGATPALAMADYCGFVDEAVIRAIIGSDPVESKPRGQMPQPASRVSAPAVHASYFGERQMAFAR